MRLKNIIVPVLLFQLVLSPFAPIAARANANAAGETDGAYETAAEEGGAAERRGLRFRLSEGAERDEAAGPRPPAAQAVKLSEAETARVLARLPELKPEGSDQQAFALREGSLPAPRAGATVLRPFPAPETRAAPDANVAGEAQVVRRSPEGEVPIAPQVSLTFSKPMVAVTSQDEAARNVPARLSPQPAGRWRWLGTKTVIFDPEEGRLPMATEFTVSVEGGVGGLKPASWNFATPAPKLTAMSPSGGPVRRDAVVFMEFDQRVEPAAVLRTLKLTAGGAPLRVRLASDDEIAADENVSRLAKAATKGRWLAVRAVGADGATRDAMPGDTVVNVTVGPGTPSAEGPRTTAAPQSFSFRTYGPFRVKTHRCGYNKCSPPDFWAIEFSNPVNIEAFDPEQVRVEPALSGVTVNAHGTSIYVHGAKRGRTTYRVTLDPGLRDAFGQTLGAHAPLSFTVGAADPSLFSSGGSFVVLDPAGGPHYSVYSVNHPALKVSLYAVEPKDYANYIAHMRTLTGYYDEKRQKPAGPPGALVSTRTVEVRGAADEMTETRLDLSPALKGGRGNVFVVVEPATRQAAAKGRAREAIRVWAQATSIGLDAFVDREGLVGWATALADGRPLEGVEMTLTPSALRATTGGDGLVRLALPQEAGAASGMLVARRGAETAFLPEHTDWWYGSSSWERVESVDQLRWFVFDDRKMYRPGEEVSLKGWLRRVGGGRSGDVGALGGAA